MILPCGVGNLHKGERYVFLVRSTLHLLTAASIDIVTWITFSARRYQLSTCFSLSSVTMWPANGSQTSTHASNLTGPMKSNPSLSWIFDPSFQSFMSRRTRGSVTSNFHSTSVSGLETRMENAQREYGLVIMRWGIRRRHKALALATTCWTTTLGFGTGKNTNQWVHDSEFSILKSNIFA